MDEKAQKILQEIMEKEKETRGTDSLTALPAGDGELVGKFEKILEKYSDLEPEDLLHVLNAALDD